MIFFPKNLVVWMEVCNIAKQTKTFTMTKTVGSIYSTFDYSQFKTLQGNRNINEINVKRLVASFEKAYLLNPVLVNEKLQIIDGQHRFEAAQRMGLPINYIIAEKYSNNEVHLLNSNMRNWVKGDYLNAYCELGNENYILMREFISDFPEFQFSVCDMIIANSVNGSNSVTSQEKDVPRKRVFQNGDMVIKDISKAYGVANKIKMIKPYYKGYNRILFVRAMIVLFKKEHFDFNIFLQKLALQPTALVDCVNLGKYYELIEDIYKYKNRNKVSLRF